MWLCFSKNHWGAWRVAVNVPDLNLLHLTLLIYYILGNTSKTGYGVKSLIYWVWFENSLCVLTAMSNVSMSILLHSYLCANKIFSNINIYTVAEAASPSPLCLCLHLYPWESNCHLMHIFALGLLWLLKHAFHTFADAYLCLQTFLAFEACFASQ